MIRLVGCGQNSSVKNMCIRFATVRQICKKECVCQMLKGVW